jgi:hypothetical protein
METGYEIEPRPVGRAPRRAPAVVAALVVVFLGVLIAKPWQGTPAAPPAPAAIVTTVIPRATATAAPTPHPTAIATPAWPAATGGRMASTLPSWANAVLSPLVRHSGAWGVGDGGDGPRLTRDTPWSDWIAAKPLVTGSLAETIFTWPGTDLCVGLPALEDRPAFIAVTAPNTLAKGWTVTGWWSDGGRVASLDGSLRQLSSTGERGITFLERLDSATWPVGRYEFHVDDGTRIVALTICLVH